MTEHGETGDARTPMRIEDREGVRHVRFNRPEKRNAFDDVQWRGLYRALHDARRDPEVAVVVLSGEGGNFSAGQDLSSFPSASVDPSASEDAQAEAKSAHPFHQCAKELYDFDKPLIGAACGAAIGFGATCLFHCDIVYAGRSLRMRLPFVSLGLVPEAASSYTLQNAIGYQRANELFFTAEWIDAERALEVGIAARICDDAELLDLALGKAAEIAQWPVAALRATKRVLRAPHHDAIWAAEREEARGMDAQVGSPENIEAIRAFLERRKPDFRALARRAEEAEG